MKREIRAAADKELPQDHAPFDFSLLPDDKDEYIITGGVFKGQRGFFMVNSVKCKQVSGRRVSWSRAKHEHWYFILRRNRSRCGIFHQQLVHMRGGAALGLTPLR